MKKTKGKFLSSRGLSLVTENGTCYPIFVGDPNAVIVNSEEHFTRINKELRNKMKHEIKAFISGLSFFSRRKAKRFLKGIKKQDFFYLVEDEELSALSPAIPLLDFVLKFCMEFNCLDVLRRCLEVVDRDVFSETPNCKINPDVLYGIMYSKNKSALHFSWTVGTENWSVVITKRKNYMKLT